MTVFGRKLHAGTVAWIIHRATGIALILYLAIHLYVLGLLRNPEEFIDLMGFMQNPLLRLTELGLLGAVSAHMLNGIRLTLMDIGVSTRFQKPLFLAAVTLWCALMAYGTITLLGGMH
jgi:succinate dehydrogenase / fumarate reductase cytochrome b subunit